MDPSEYCQGIHCLSQLWIRNWNAATDQSQHSSYSMCCYSPIVLWCHHIKMAEVILHHQRIAGETVIFLCVRARVWSQTPWIEQRIWKWSTTRVRSHSISVITHKYRIGID